MALLDALSNPYVQFGLGLLGRNTVPYMNTAAQIRGAAGDVAQAQAAQQAAQRQQQQRQWMQQNMPAMAGAPAFAQKAAAEAMFRAPPKQDLKMVMGPDGRPIWMPASQAAGMEAFSKPLVVNKLGNELRSLPEQFALDAAQAEMGAIIGGSEGAWDNMQRARRGKELLRYTETGPYQPFMADVAKYLGVKPEMVANTQLFHALMGDFVMGRIQETKGAVSEKEMAYFNAISPGVEKDPFTNYVLLEIYERQQRRNADKVMKYRTYFNSPEYNKTDFNTWYMQKHDPWKGEFNLQQLREQFDREIGGMKRRGYSPEAQKYVKPRP